MKEKKDIKVAGNSEAERRREEEAYNRGEEVKEEKSRIKGFLLFGFFFLTLVQSLFPPLLLSWELSSELPELFWRC